MAPVTLKDLAKKLGVSITTVSKALKDYSDISKETKQQVRQLAAELNYQPNIHAVNLRVQRSLTLGVIVPKVEHYFFAKVLDGIITEAQKNGYLTITLFSNDDLQEEEKQVNLLINKRVDGVLMILSHQSQLHEQDHIFNILAHDIPLVLLDRTSSAIPCSKVIIDDQKVGYKAVRHLIEGGSKNILYIGGSNWQLNYRKRYNGYIQALSQYAFAEQDRLVKFCNKNCIEEAEEIAYKTIKENEDIDAVFASTDFIAFGAIKAIDRLGKKIPEDIQVIGVSNWFMNEHISNGISTVKQPSHKMGEEGVKIILEEITKKENSQEVSPKILMLPTELVLRGSTRLKEESYNKE